MIDVRNLTVRMGGKTLLTDVSLALRAGEVLAVVGPNGAGKSTLLRAMAGELKSREGAVLFAERPLPQWDALSLARRRAVVSQSVELAFAMTAEEVVALGRLPWHGAVEARNDAEVVKRVMLETGVHHLADRMYATMSGGERQRVQFSRALAQLEGTAAPAVLLLDEPTGSLDAAHRATLLRMLRAEAAKGTAVLAVLHDLNEALFVGDRVAIIANGRLATEGTAAEVLRPAVLKTVFNATFRQDSDGGLLQDYGEVRVNVGKAI